MFFCITFFLEIDENTENITLESTIYGIIKINSVYENIADAVSGKPDLSKLKENLNNATDEWVINNENLKESIKSDYFHSSYLHSIVVSTR